VEAADYDMPCYSPLDAYQNAKGGKVYFAATKKNPSDMKMLIPCGQCIGCRLEKSRQWAVRCMHESSLYENNIFITLTYDDDNIPQDNSLIPDHFTKFLKDLRYHVSHTEEEKRIYKKLRYFHCGEYGDETKRPHYHAIIFNHDFDDKKLHSTRDNIRLYTSDILSNIWKRGFVTIGDVTFESCAYVSRYVTKKITGKSLDKYNDAGLKPYEKINPYGEIIQLEPEYATMSRRPGIGYDWYQKYKKEVYPADSIVMNGVEQQPPAYYDSIFAFEDYINSYENKIKRGHKIDPKEYTHERLEAKRRVKEAQLSFLKNTI